MNNFVGYRAFKIFIIKTADDPCRFTPLSRVKERLKLISRNNKDFKVQQAEINQSVALIDNVS